MCSVCVCGLYTSVRIVDAIAAEIGASDTSPRVIYNMDTYWHHHHHHLQFPAVNTYATPRPLRPDRYHGVSMPAK